MNAIYCEKCKKYFEKRKMTSHGSKLYQTLDGYLAPSPLISGDTHLCDKCASLLGEIIKEWLGYKVDKLRLVGTDKAQLIPPSRSCYDDDIDNLATDCWGGAGPDCLPMQREAA